MAGRPPARGRIPKEVQAIFQKYQEGNAIARRLTKDEALKMFHEEFNLNDEQANQMFETFDKDKNGIMSLWEFQQFYQVVGGDAAQIVDKFLEMDADGSGKIDPAEARVGLKSMTLGGDRKLEDKEIDFFIKSSTGEDNLIDLGHFANLLFQLKLYNKRRPQKKK